MAKEGTHPDHRIWPKRVRCMDCFNAKTIPETGGRKWRCVNPPSRHSGNDMTRPRLIYLPGRKFAGGRDEPEGTGYRAMLTHRRVCRNFEGEEKEAAI